MIAITGYNWENHNHVKVKSSILKYGDLSFYIAPNIKYINGFISALINSIRYGGYCGFSHEDSKRDILFFSADPFKKNNITKEHIEFLKEKEKPGKKPKGKFHIISSQTYSNENILLELNNNIIKYKPDFLFIDDLSGIIFKKEFFDNLSKICNTFNVTTICGIVSNDETYSKKAFLSKYKKSCILEYYCEFDEFYGVNKMHEEIFCIYNEEYDNVMYCKQDEEGNIIPFEKSEFSDFYNRYVFSQFDTFVKPIDIRNKISVDLNIKWSSAERKIIAAREKGYFEEKNNMLRYKQDDNDKFCIFRKWIQ